MTETSKEFEYLESKLGTLKSYDTIYLRVHEMEELLTNWHELQLSEYRATMFNEGLKIDENERT